MSTRWLGWPTVLLAAVLAAALVSDACVRGVRVAMHRRRILDVPNERSSHDVPTPRGGGWGIVVPVGLAALALALSVGPGELRTRLLAYLSALGLIAAVSWLDDLRPVPSGPRLLVHVVASVLVVWHTDLTALSASLHLPELAVAGLAAFWIAGLTNAYNFMDGIDGLAGGQAVVAGSAWMAMLSTADPVTAALAAAIVGGALGFLRHNWSPASIFLGDIGSASLGFSFATLPLLAIAAAPSRAPTWLALALAAMWPFVFDTGVTVLRRAWRRENLLAAHRTHLYQRLVTSGLTHAAVTTRYLALAIVGAGLVAVADAFRSIPAVGALVVGSPILVLALLHWWDVRRLERRSRSIGPAREL